MWLQREPWEQQGVHSGSEAALQPLPYKLDQRGVFLTAVPSVSPTCVMLHTLQFLSVPAEAGTGHTAHSITTAAPEAESALSHWSKSAADHPLCCRGR